MFANQYPRPPTYTYTNPPLLYHRQPPTPGGSPGISSGQLVETAPPIKSDYEEPHALLHHGGQPPGYPHVLHAVSDMGVGMDYGPASLFSFPSDMIGSHQHHTSSLPSMQHPHPTSERYPGGFPVMAAFGDALDEKYERGSAYSSSDFSSSDVGFSSNSHLTRSEYKTERFLREHLNIPEPTPLNLDAIAHESKPGIKTMIILSIWASPEKHLTLQGIYEAIETRFPHRKSANDKPWQRSIRHNLSLKAMFVFEERRINHPGKGRYWRIDISKGTGNKRNRKRKTGKRGGRRDGDEGGEDDEEYMYDDEDEDEAGSRDQAHARQYDRPSFDPSRGMTQSQSPPNISLPSNQGMNMNYMMGATNFSSQLNFQSPTDFRRGPLHPNMNTAQFGDRPTTVKSYPPTGTSYSSLNPPGGNLLRATSLPPLGPIYHPGPHVEMLRRNTTGRSGAVGRHQHQHPHQYGDDKMVSHSPIPDFSSMQQSSSHWPRRRTAEPQPASPAASWPLASVECGEPGCLEEASTSMRRSVFTPI